MDRSTARLLLSFSFVLLLTACGGGGGDPAGAGSGTPPSTPPTPPPTGTPAPFDAAAEASRFLSQAAFGGTRAEIDALANSGDYSAWFEQQAAMPATLHTTALNDLLRRFWTDDRTRAELDAAGVPYYLETGDDGMGPEEPESLVESTLLTRYAWWTTVMRAPDQLRQRVAYALSQLVVVSDRTDPTSDFDVMAAYYDILQRNALGSFRQLLEEISYSTAMGLYLTHMGNDKGDPTNGVFPDENYARELMQLFTIGLWELNEDGSRKLDMNGNPIASYTTSDVTELAKVFTGLGPNGGSVFSATNLEEHDPERPMAVWEAHHSPGPKRLIDGSITSAGTAADIDSALDALVAHANTGPFIATFLIRRLTSSNPSRDYVRRVARAFANNGSGVRGDLKAVVKAVLLDPEARDPANRTTASGKLREPALRYVHLLKAFDAKTDAGPFMVRGGKLQDKNDVAAEMEPAQLGQHPLSAPSVFNFYLNDFQPKALESAGLVSPESQIINATTVSAYNRLLRQVLFENRLIDTMFTAELDEDFPTYDWRRYDATFRDLDRYVAIGSDPARLIRELNVVLAAGNLSEATEALLVSKLSDPRAANLDARARVQFAIYLVMLSPAYLHRN